VPLSKSGESFKKILMTNPVEFSNLSPLSIPLKLSKEKLSKSKYHGKNQKNLKTNLTKRKDVLILNHHLEVLRKSSN